MCVGASFIYFHFAFGALCLLYFDSSSHLNHKYFWVTGNVFVSLFLVFPSSPFFCFIRITYPIQCLQHPHLRFFLSHNYSFLVFMSTQRIKPFRLVMLCKIRVCIFKRRAHETRIHKQVSAPHQIFLFAPSISAFIRHNRHKSNGTNRNISHSINISFI